MSKIKVIVTCNRKIIRDGVALIFDSAQHLEVAGRVSLTIS